MYRNVTSRRILALGKLFLVTLACLTLAACSMSSFAPGGSPSDMSVTDVTQSSQIGEISVESLVPQSKADAVIQQFYTNFNYQKSVYEPETETIVYRYRVQKSYPYMDEDKVVDMYFQKTGDQWKYSYTNDVENHEKWHVEGTWRYQDNIPFQVPMAGSKTCSLEIKIESFDGETIRCSCNYHYTYGFTEYDEQWTGNTAASSCNLKLEDGNYDPSYRIALRKETRTGAGIVLNRYVGVWVEDDYGTEHAAEFVQ